MNQDSHVPALVQEKRLPVDEFGTLLNIIESFANQIQYERTPENEHFMALGKRVFHLARGVQMLTSAGDGLSAMILLRSQLEVFARIASFLTNGKTSLDSEIANELDQLKKIQTHFEAYPGAPYSIDVSDYIKTIKEKWPNIDSKPNKAVTVKSAFLSGEPPSALGVSAYGLYQTLCMESHAGFSAIVSRHRELSGANSPVRADTKVNPHELHATLGMSAWIAVELCCLALSNDAQTETQDFLTRIKSMSKEIEPKKLGS